jgi:hypothetical protein
MLVALEWAFCPSLVVQAFVSLGLVPDGRDSVGEDGDGLFLLRLLLEGVRRVRSGAVLSNQMCHFGRGSPGMRTGV